MDIEGVHPETRRHSRISFGMVIALAIVAVFAWGYTQKLLRERRQEAEYRAKDATARRGNPVLSVPLNRSLSCKPPADVQPALMALITLCASDKDRCSASRGI